MRTVVLSVSFLLDPHYGLQSLYGFASSYCLKQAGLVCGSQSYCSTDGGFRRYVERMSHLFNSHAGRVDDRMPWHRAGMSLREP